MALLNSMESSRASSSRSDKWISLSLLGREKLPLTWHRGTRGLWTTSWRSGVLELLLIFELERSCCQTLALDSRTRLRASTQPLAHGVHLSLKDGLFVLEHLHPFLESKGSVPQGVKLLPMTIQPLDSDIPLMAQLLAEFIHLEIHFSLLDKKEDTKRMTLAATAASRAANRPINRFTTFLSSAIWARIAPTSCSKRSA